MPNQINRTIMLGPAPGNQGTGQYILGDASDGIVGTFSVHLYNMSGLGASAVVKARSRLEQAYSDNAPFLPIPYLALYLNGAVGAVTYQVAPLTADSIILIPATGLQIMLDVTYTGGTGRIYWCPCEGAAA